MRVRRIVAAIGAAVVVAGGGIAGAAPASAADCSVPAAPGVDWSGCDKSDLFLSSADLRGANLSGTILTNAFLPQANLAGANLSGASAQGADFYQGNLSGANLSGIDLTSGLTKFANLTGINLTGANLTGVYLGGADLADAFVDCGTGGVLGTGVVTEDDIVDPPVLPNGWTLVDGTLRAPVVECPPIAPIPAWVQAYGRESVDSPCLNGWDASWQEWAVPVTGGWVCTRSIPSLG